MSNTFLITLLETCAATVSMLRLCAVLLAKPLRSWNGLEHQQGHYSPAVASKQEAHASMLTLSVKLPADLPETTQTNSYQSRELSLPDLGSDIEKVELSQIGDRELAVNRKIKVTKEQRLMQHRSEAAAKVLTQTEGVALENAELAWIFESLRAAVHVTFDFHSMIRILWGFSNLQQAASILCDFPDVRRLRELQDAFHAAGMSPSDKFKCIRVLLLLVELKERAQWFSSTFEALGKENQWFDWLPRAIQASVLLLRPIAFRLLRVNEAIRGELPVCPVDSIHYALIPALTPPHFPIVIVVKISFPPIMQLGAIFTADRVSCSGLINQLGLADQCMNDGEEPCVCYKNGIPFSNHPIFVHHSDFVSCHKGRSYTLVEDEMMQ